MLRVLPGCSFVYDPLLELGMSIFLGPPRRRVSAALFIKSIADLFHGTNYLSEVRTKPKLPAAVWLLAVSGTAMKLERVRIINGENLQHSTGNVFRDLPSRLLPRFSFPQTTVTLLER